MARWKGTHMLQLKGGYSVSLMRASWEKVLTLCNREEVDVVMWRQPNDSWAHSQSAVARLPLSDENDSQIRRYSHAAMKRVTVINQGCQSDERILTSCNKEDVIIVSQGWQSELIYYWHFWTLQETFLWPLVICQSFAQDATLFSYHQVLYHEPLWVF